MRLLLILLLICVAACRPKQEEPPAGLLSKEQMTHALIQLHLLEADLESKHLLPDSAKAIFAREENKLLKKAGIPEAKFRQSFDFYLRNPRYMDIIYAAVVDSLSLREALTTQQETLGDTALIAPSPAPAVPKR